MPPERKYDYPKSEYSRAIERLGWTQVGAAEMLGLDPRTSRRYVSGDPMPKPLQNLLRVLVAIKRTDEWFAEVTSKPVR